MNNTSSHISKVQELRKNARRHIEEGAVTAGYKADKTQIIKLLNEALATELVCVLRYKSHYFMAQGIHAEPVAREFLEHAKEEQVHADMIAARITQLGGKPNLNPDQLTAQSHTEYREGSSLVDMVYEDLVAERIAIQSYMEMVHYIGDKDPTTRRILEHVMGIEEEHADDMAKILADLDPEPYRKKNNNKRRNHYA